MLKISWCCFNSDSVLYWCFYLLRKTSLYRLLTLRALFHLYSMFRDLDSGFWDVKDLSFQYRYYLFATDITSAAWTGIRCWIVDYFVWLRNLLALSDLDDLFAPLLGADFYSVNFLFDEYSSFSTHRKMGAWSLSDYLFPNASLALLFFRCSAWFSFSKAIIFCSCSFRLIERTLSLFGLSFCSIL